MGRRRVPLLSLGGVAALRSIDRSRSYLAGLGLLSGLLVVRSILPLGLTQLASLIQPSRVNLRCYAHRMRWILVESWPLLWLLWLELTGPFARCRCYRLIPDPALIENLRGLLWSAGSRLRTS